MIDVYKLKILIVGLTTVLALTSFNKNDFRITIEDGVLTISAEKEEKSEDKTDGYLRKEFSYNSFTRSIILPESVDDEKEVKAEYQDGVLKLTLEKKPEEKLKKTKTIKIS